MSLRDIAPGVPTPAQCGKKSQGATLKVNRMATASLADYAAVINDEHRAAFGSAQDAIEHARVAGEHLLKAKAALKHGEWLPWLKSNVEMSEVQAQRYMRVAQNWTALESKSVTVTDLTLRGALEALAKPKPKPEPEVSAPAAPAETAGPQITADQEPGDVVDVPVAPEKPAESVEPAFVEDEAPEESEFETLKVAHAELLKQLEETQADLDSLIAISDANDQVKAAVAEAKKFREINRVLEERIRGLQNEKNAAIRSAKSWQRKYEDLRKGVPA